MPSAVKTLLPSLYHYIIILKREHCGPPPASEDGLVRNAHAQHAKTSSHRLEISRLSIVMVSTHNRKGETRVLLEPTRLQLALALSIVRSKPNGYTVRGHTLATMYLRLALVLIAYRIHSTAPTTYFGSAHPSAKMSSATTGCGCLLENSMHVPRGREARTTEPHCIVRTREQTLCGKGQECRSFCKRIGIYSNYRYSFCK